MAAGRCWTPRATASTGRRHWREAAGVSGPEISRLVSLLAEEQAAGDVTSREQALAFVREQAR